MRKNLPVYCGKVPCSLNLHNHWRPVVAGWPCPDQSNVNYLKYETTQNWMNFLGVFSLSLMHTVQFANKAYCILCIFVWFICYEPNISSNWAMPPASSQTLKKRWNSCSAGKNIRKWKYLGRSPAKATKRRKLLEYYRICYSEVVERMRERLSTKTARKLDRRGT